MKSIGIIGINGMVGQTLLEDLKNIPFPVDVKTFRRSDPFTPVDVAVLCTDNADTVRLLPSARQNAKFVIDMSSEYRLAPDVPLVIPEINPHAVTEKTPLIASPNCTTTGLVMSMAPLKPFYEMTEAFFCSYQAISGGGRKLLDEFHTPGSYYENNCVPLIGSIQANGYSSEELKGIYETRKILELPRVRVYPHTVRVAVDNSHSLGVTLRAKQPFDLDQVKALWNAFPNLIYTDEIVTPKQASGKLDTFICRLRRDAEEDNVIHYFVTFDNLLKGAAMNARQITELILEKWL